MTVTTAIGPPGVGKTITELMENRKVFGKTALLVMSAHADLPEKTGSYAVHDGFEHLSINDRLKSSAVVPNYQTVAQVDSSGIQREQDLITVSDDLRQILMTQRGYDKVHEHPWVQEGLTFAFDVLVTMALQPWQLAHIFSFGSQEQLEIIARMPIHLRAKLAEFAEMSKFERERVLGAAKRLIGMMLRGPMFRERFDKPGEKIDLDRHFSNKGILIINGSGVSDEQYRVMATFMLMRAIVGAMRFGYAIKISVDEATPLITPWLIRKLEEVRKFAISISLLLQHLPIDPEIRGRLLKASTKRIWYACYDPEERHVASRDLIAVLNRNKVKWWDTRHIQLREPSVDVDRVTTSQSDNGKFGKDRRTTKGKSVTTVEKQMWRTFEERIPHYESGAEQLFWFEQDLAGLGHRERWVAYKNAVWFEKTKWLGRMYPGCPGLEEGRYAAALERIESRPYYRMPQEATLEVKGAAWRLQQIQAAEQNA